MGDAAPERAPAEADRETEDRDTERPSPARRCPCCGGRMIIVETFQGPRPRPRHRRPGSGSTPHDGRRASRRPTPFLLASNRAPEQESAVLTTPADLLQAPRLILWTAESSVVRSLLVGLFVIRTVSRRGMALHRVTSPKPRLRASERKFPAVSRAAFPPPPAILCSMRLSQAPRRNLAFELLHRPDEAELLLSRQPVHSRYKPRIHVASSAPAASRRRVALWSLTSISM